MNINLVKETPHSIYHLMTQAVIPRPVAWVLTDSGDQSYNIAPFSFFTPVSSLPPLLMISLGKKPNGQEKDTLVNAKEQQKMVIHIAQTEQAKVVTQSSATLEHGESEVLANGLTLVDFDGFPLPRVAVCPIAFGCKLYKTESISEEQTLLFAAIEQIYIDEQIIDHSDKSRLVLDPLAIAPLARLGGIEFAELDRTFKVARP